MFSFRILIIACVGLLSFFTRPVFAEQITLTAVADTSLWQRETNHNLGGAPFLPVGSVGSDGNFRRTRMLVKFDLQGAIPDGSTIDSASVYFRVVRAPDPNKLSRNSNFRGYRVLKDWGEGNKIYSDPQTPMTSTLEATAGEATWDHRFYGDETRTWAEPGGDFTDNDYAEAYDFQFFTSISANQDEVAGLNPDGVDTINAWLANPDSNLGWVIATERETFGGTARHLASRENEIPGYRPQLTIAYTVPGPSPPEISISRIDEMVTVDYSAEVGVVYRPQYKSTVNGSVWTNLPDQGPLNADGQLQFTDDVSGVDERYYQVIIPSP